MHLKEMLYVRVACHSQSCRLPVECSNSVMYSGQNVQEGGLRKAEKKFNSDPTQKHLHNVSVETATWTVNFLNKLYKAATSSVKQTVF